MHKILIADSHSIFRETLGHYLEKLNNYHVAGEVDSADAVIAQLNTGIDILILELSLNKDDVFSLIKRVRHEYSALKIVVLSMHTQEDVVRKALSSGIDAYVSKSSNIIHLNTALQKVLSGNKYFSDSISDIVLNSINHKDGLPHELLTDRELEVFIMLGRGFSSNDIASELALSAKTVSTHKSKIMQKMHLSSNADLIKYYVNSTFNHSHHPNKVDGSTVF